MCSLLQSSKNWSGGFICKKRQDSQTGLIQRKDALKNDTEYNQLVEIARPFAQDMKHLKPSLTREFNQYVPFKVSFTLTVIVFIVSTVLHLVFMYVDHRFNLKDRIFPKKTAKKNAMEPVLHYFVSLMKVHQQFSKNCRNAIICSP